MASIIWNGVENLDAALKRLSTSDFDAAGKLSITEIFNRAKNGGTPVKTGELRRSLSADLDGLEVGYNKEYAPHVEYGHRVVRNGKQVGYVPGQYYLKKNVDKQRPKYYRDLIDTLKKGGG